MDSSGFDATNSPGHFGRARTRIHRRIDDHYRLTFSEMSVDELVEIEKAKYWQDREIGIATMRGLAALSAQAADYADRQDKNFQILTDVVSRGFESTATDES